MNGKDISRMLREGDRAAQMLEQARKVEQDRRWWLGELMRTAATSPAPPPQL